MSHKIDIPSHPTEYAEFARGYHKNSCHRNYGTTSIQPHSSPTSYVMHVPRFATHNLTGIDEQTPLINSSKSLKASKCIDVRVFSLGVLFIGGITVGGIIMHYEVLPCPMGVEFDLVNREEWGASYLPFGRQLFSDNVVHVLIQHTATENCFNMTECKDFMYNYQQIWQQKQNIDIPFNFLIGGDGRAYEARGWSVESDHTFIRSNSSLSIAFIGNFTETIPSDKQTSTAHALISELKFQKKISDQYLILGIRYHKRAHYDADALFRETSKWKRWDDIFTIYS